MRKIILLSIIAFLTGCAPVIPSEPVQNPKCIYARSATVMRVLDNYVLAWVDDINDRVSHSVQSYYRPTDDHFIFLPRDKNRIYFPRQRLDLDPDQCLVYTGAYNYQQGGKGTTILMGQLVNERIPNPAYDKWKRDYDERAKNSCWLQRRQHKKCTKK